MRPGAVSDKVTLSIVLRVRGRLDLNALAQAFDLLVDRHEVLRSELVPAKGRCDAHAEVRPHRPLKLEFEDAVASDTELFSRWDDATIDPFTPPLARCFVAPRGRDEHLIGLLLSHIVADPTGLRIAVRDLSEAYEACRERRAISPLRLQYGEYAAWQAARLDTRAEDNRAAWARTLAGLKPPRYRRQIPFVPGRRAAPVLQTTQVFTRSECEALTRWSFRHRSTLFTTLLAAFARAVREDADSDDLPISTVFEQRDHPEARHMLGLFLHPTVVRVRVDEREPMPPLVERTRVAVLDAYRHAQTPLREFLALMPRFIPGAVGLAPAWFRFFQFVPMERGTYRFGQATATIAHVGGRADPQDLLGLQLGVFHAEDGSLHGKLSYDSHDLDAPSAQRVLVDFKDHALEVVQ